MRSRTLITVIVVCGLTSVLHADYRDAFRRGVQAARRNRWSEVVKAMDEARKEEPRDTGERINISGMDFVPYVPNFYLGLARYHTKDCVGALAAWQALGQLGLQQISGRERGTVANYRKECDTRIASATKPEPVANPVRPVETPTPPERLGPDPAAIDAAVQTAAAATMRAEELERAVARLASDALLGRVWQTDAALGPSEQRARDALRRARSELDAGRGESNLERLQEAATAAGLALREFGGVLSAAEARRAEIAAAAAAAGAAKTVPIAPEASPGATAPKPAPAMPAALTAAARLFFRAQYAEAAASLRNQRYSPGAAAGHAALFTAASSYALYLVDGEKDAALLEQARGAVREARRVAPTLQPDPGAFSPRFVAFYRLTR